MSKSLIILSLLLIFSPLISLQAEFTSNVRPNYCNYDEYKDKTCPESWQPVMAYFKNGQYNVYNHECYACSDERVGYYYYAKQCLRYYDTCTEDLDPVCALTPYGLIGYANECKVCQNRYVFWYYKGVCPQKKEWKTTQCDPKKWYGWCWEQYYKPVCAHLKDKTWKTYWSSCEACQDCNVEYYKEGTCYDEYVVIKDEDDKDYNAQPPKYPMGYGWEADKNETYVPPEKPDDYEEEAYEEGYEEPAYEEGYEEEAYEEEAYEEEAYEEEAYEEEAYEEEDYEEEAYEEEEYVEEDYEEEEYQEEEYKEEEYPEPEVSP